MRNLTCAPRGMKSAPASLSVAHAVDSALNAFAAAHHDMEQSLLIDLVDL